MTPTPTPTPPNLANGLKQGAILVALGLAAGGVAWYFSHQIAMEQRAGSSAPYSLPLNSGGPTADDEITFYQQRIANNPDGFLDLVSLGEAYLRKARVTNEPSYYLLAEQAARRSLKNMPSSNDGATMVLARVAIARHDFDQALKLAQGIEKAGRTSESVLSAYATIHLAQGRTKEAARAAEFLLKASPGIDTYSQLGLVRVAEGRDADAVMAFEKAIAAEQAGQRDASASARTWLGRLHMRRGRLSEAQALFGEALRIAPGHAQALTLSAELALREGRAADAERLYTQAYTASPNAVLLGGQAQAKALAGDAAGADALTTQAVEALRRDLIQGDFGHRRDLARLLLTRQRPEADREALALLKEERASRQDAETLELSAWALGRAGRWDEADAMVKQALATGASEASLFACAAVVAGKRGDAMEAARLSARAHAVDPSFTDDPAYKGLVAGGLSVTK